MKLFVTYCSGKKRQGRYSPDLLYISGRISRFIEHCKILGINWAIFSALHALFFPEEEKRDYNATFKADKTYWLGISVIKNSKKLSPLKSKEHILLLTKKLRTQAKKHNVDQIVFYGPSPMMMKCYLGVLHYAFDRCSKIHGWRELIEHVTKQSETIKVIHKLTNLI